MNLRTGFGATLGVAVSALLLSSNAVVTAGERAELPPLPHGLTSFGAVVCERDLYVYGGHRGDVHEYSRDDQSGQLLRLDLDGGKQWEELPGGPKMQSTVLVAHGGKVIRVGGFAAKNGKDEDSNYWSLDEVAAFDPQSGKWSKLPSLPTARSSHAAAVLGDELYVVGGWSMMGDEGREWAKTTLVLDLSDPKAGWREIEAPFERRALAGAAANGKVYAIGGLSSDGDVTTGVDVLDIESGKWSEGPQLAEGRFEGFSPSAITAGKDAQNVYVTTGGGRLYELKPGAAEWRVAESLEQGRAAHVLVAAGEQRLIQVGGVNREVGKITALEVLPVR